MTIIRFALITLVVMVIISTLFNVGIYWIMFKWLNTNYYIVLVMQSCTGMLAGAVYFHSIIQYAKEELIWNKK